MSKTPRVTVAVPSYNQGDYLEAALVSLFNQDVPIEVFVMDGGSTDQSLTIIKKWQDKLAGWRSYKDEGQSAAINEGIAQGTAPYVCWLNSDDWLLDGALTRLLQAFEEYPDAPAVYGNAFNYHQKKQIMYPVWVEPFSERRLALRCIISQPATLVRREAWECVGGLDDDLHMAMDYDLWWRLYKAYDVFGYVNEAIAVNRMHDSTKTKTQRRLHYREAIKTVHKYYGHVPMKWWVAQPYAVWFKALFKNG